MRRKRAHTPLYGTAAVLLQPGRRRCPHRAAPPRGEAVHAGRPRHLC